MSKIKLFYFGVLLILLIIYMGCTHTKDQRPNIIFIMSDDHAYQALSAYSDRLIKTPNIDKLAEQSTLFENAYAEGLPTIPVRKALFTGRYTLPFSGWEPLYSDDRTLSEIFYWEGIRSILITDTLPMHMPRFGYERGFDHVEYIRG